MTVRELLDRAAREIEGKFAQQELTEAAIRLTIGDAYRALGEFPESQKHLLRSVQLRTAKLGPDHADTDGNAEQPVLRDAVGEIVDPPTRRPQRDRRPGAPGSGGSRGR